MITIRSRLLWLCFMMIGGTVFAQGRTDTTFHIFQFPANMIPRIDGDTSDWSMVPDSYSIGTDQLTDDTGRHKTSDRKTLDVRVKVGWVKGLDRLYFLYEAYDNYWDFTHTGLHNDILEVVVDGDLSGGPLIARFRPDTLQNFWDAYFNFQSVHAQNYHIFTPAVGKEWAMIWGPQKWLARLPYSNEAYSYHFKPGESGKLILEFWITPFDYASADGPAHSVESKLYENKIIGLSWAVLDYDDVNSSKEDGFWNLSHKHTMYGRASQLVMFRLMPLEPKFKKKIDAKWSFKVVDMNKRLVYFKDESTGNITSWKWDFGDGTESIEQNPVHRYAKPGHYTVVLNVKGKSGRSRLAKVWEVAVK